MKTKPKILMLVPPQGCHRSTTAAVQELDETLIPQVEALAKVIEAKAEDWKNVVKIGRTHLEDAVPLTFGHHQQLPALGAHPGRRLPEVPRVLGGRCQAQPGSDRQVRR